MSLIPSSSNQQHSSREPSKAVSGISGVQKPSGQKEASNQGLIAPRPEQRETKEGFWGSFRLFDRTEVPGNQRVFGAVNFGLERAWNQSNPLCWVLARVRCEFLKMTPDQYASCHRELPAGTLRGLELPHSFEKARYNPVSIHRLLLGWEKIAEREHNSNPTLSNQLREAKREVLHVLTQRHGDGVYGVLARWRYEVGPEKFDTASGYSDSAMWNRRAAGTMFEFGELVRIATALDIIPQRVPLPAMLAHPRICELNEAWMRDAEVLGRPAPLSDLFRMLSVCGFQLTAIGLQNDHRVPLRAFDVDMLCRYRMIPWQKVEPLVQVLKATKLFGDLELKKLEAEWSRAYAERPVSHGESLVKILHERRISVRKLAQALRLQVPSGEVSAGSITHYLKYDRKNKLVSPGVLSHLVGRSEQEVGDLLDVKRAEISTQLKCTGSLISSPCAIERELWSVDYSDLPFEKAEIQRLEWGQKSSLDTEQVLNAIRAVGEERARKSLESLLAARELNTVRGTVDALLYQRGSANLEALCGTSDEMLKMIQEGVHVPELSKLVQFLERVGHELPPEVEIDWREQSARHLKARNHSDVERVIYGHMIEGGIGINDVLRVRRAGSDITKRRMRWLGQVGLFPPSKLPSLLARLGLDTKNPRALFISSVNGQGSIVLGLRAWLCEMDERPEYSWVRGALLEELQTSPTGECIALTLGDLRAQVLHWERGYRRACPADGYLEARSYLPGVTKEEIAQALTSGVELGRSRMEELRAHGRKARIKAPELLFSLRNCAPSHGRPGELVRAAMKRGIFSAACPRGVVACVGAADLKEARQLLAKERELITAELDHFGIPGVNLSAEMLLWGLKPADLTCTKRQFDRVVWATATTALPPRLGVNPNEVDVTRERLMERARKKGAAKISRVLQEVIKIRRVVDPVGVLELAVGSCQVSANRDSNHRYEFGRRLAAFSEEGTPIAPHGLVNAAKVVGLEVTPEMRLAWMDSYAGILAKQRVSPLGRVILCQIVGKYLASLAPGAQSPGRHWLDRVVSNFFNQHGLSTFSFRREFKRACETGEAGYGFLEQIGKALGHDKGSLGHEFIELAAGVDTLEYAIAAILEQVKEKPGEERAFFQLGRSVRNLSARYAKLRLMEGWSIEDLFKYKTLACRSHGSRISPEVERAGMLVAGVTHRDLIKAWIDAYPSSHKFLSTRSRQEELWIKDEALLARPLEGRLFEVAARLLRGERVVCADLLELWPEKRALLKAVDAHLSPVTAWYVAATAFYKYPDDALQEISKGLEQERRPRGTPRDFFERHQKMQAMRRDMPKLNSTTIRLFLKARSGEA